MVRSGTVYTAKVLCLGFYLIGWSFLCNSEELAIEAK